MNESSAFCIGRCVDLGEQIWPLAPLREIVADLVDDLDEASLDDLLGSARSRAVLGRLVPELDQWQVDDSSVTSAQVCELSIGLFKRLARRGPLLLVFEDLHWADDTTRTLFSALARVGRIEPSLLVGTFRDDELHRRHPLRAALAEIQRQQRCERVELSPLDAEATAELIGRIDGGHLDPRLTEELIRRSAGNPFYVEELVAAARQGVTGLPETLRDTLIVRTAVLNETAQRVLGVTAAAGAVPLSVVGDVCQLEEDDLRDVLDELCTWALLVVEGDDLRFRHELGREVFQDELLPGERARIHARLADSIARRRPDRIGAIARHWSAAHDAPRALAASVAAGRQALRVGAAAEAEGHLDRALELWAIVDEAASVAGVDHAALLLETAIAARHAHHIERAIALDLSAANELADVDALREARAWLHLRSLYRFGDRWDECAAAGQRALGLIPESPPSAILAEALTYAAMDSSVNGRFTDATTWARQAIVVAERVDEPEALIQAHYALWFTTIDDGAHEAALDIAQANVARCDDSTSAELTLMALNSVTNSLEALGRYAECISIASSASSWPATRGSAALAADTWPPTGQ